MKLLLLIFIVFSTAFSQQIVFEKEHNVPNFRYSKNSLFINGEQPVFLYKTSSYTEGDSLNILVFSKDFNKIENSYRIVIPEEYELTSMDALYYENELYIMALGDDDKHFPDFNEFAMWKINQNSEVENITLFDSIAIEGIQAKFTAKNGKIFFVSDDVDWDDPGKTLNSFFVYNMDLDLIKSKTLQSTNDSLYIGSKFLKAFNNKLFLYGNINKKTDHGYIKTFGNVVVDNDLEEISMYEYEESFVNNFNIKDILINEKHDCFGWQKEIDELGVEERKTVVFQLSVFNKEKEEGKEYIFRKDTVNELSGIASATDGNVLLFGTTGNYYEEFNQKKLREFQNYIVKFNPETEEILWETEFGDDKFFDNVLHIKAIEDDKYLLVSNRNNNRIVLSVLEDIPSGIKNSYKENIKIYPNPATDKLHIKNLHPNQNISFYNLFGEEIKLPVLRNESSCEVNVSKLNSGMYLVKIAENGNSIFKKFIKK